MNSWFSSQSSSRQSLEPAGPARGRRSEHISPPDKVGESGIEQDGVQVDPQPATDHQFVPVLSTPHDAVLADISGHPLNAMPFSTSDVVRSDIASSVPLPKPSLGSMERVDGTTSPSGTLGKSIIVGDLTSAAGPSSATSPVPNTAPELEQMYDPFTGQPIGFLPPHSSPNSRIPVQINPSPRDASHERSETVQSQAQFEQSKEDLWSHVAKIRKLQSEIAGMHIDLEGIGQGGDAFGVSLGGGNGGGVGGMPKRPSGPGGRLHGDTIGGGEQWYDPEEEEKERKRAMDAEFQTLAETFDGRAGAINGIMEKV